MSISERYTLTPELTAALDEVLDREAERQTETLLLVQERAVVEIAIRAFAAGNAAGRDTPNCGCVKCETCGNWRSGSWCDLCEETL